MTQEDVTSLHRRVRQALARGPPCARCEGKERSQAQFLPSWGKKRVEKWTRLSVSSLGPSRKLRKEEVRKGGIYLQIEPESNHFSPRPHTLLPPSSRA